MQRSARIVIVTDYDTSWPATFLALQRMIREVLRDLADSVEHVGSTSVPGLAAKPIIDIDAIVSHRDRVSAATERLRLLGYVHQGNLGIEDREAYETPAGLPAHHLYVCISGSPALINHITVRDYLRTHPECAAAYGRLKKELARRFPYDVGQYTRAKSEFILQILRNAGIALPTLE
jgi:GrpB-like predicted nucleotidyltransferase (UPF0157 family)